MATIFVDNPNCVREPFNASVCVYEHFDYQAYHYELSSEGLSIWFDFSIDDNIKFQPRTFIPNRYFLNFSIAKDHLDCMVFNIGMVELISYWKAYCPPVINVQCATLTPEQVAFWRHLYFLGLGEFFYVNGIETSESSFVGIRSVDGLNTQPVGQERELLRDGYVVPIGGGKDSVVTLEKLLTHYGHKRVRPLIMNPRGATVACAETAGYALDEVIIINRTIDERLLEANARGALNGHTPFSAMLGFYTILAANLCGYRNIALSNESSANEPTVIGSNVNHQYSKSFDFEADFRNYVSKFVSSQANYFSFLRPLTEIQIASLFATYKQYHSSFRSCNVGSKSNSWCGHCPKCLFAFIILSPFMMSDGDNPFADLEKIFGHNLLDDSSLQLSFDQLTGKAETKPFECVGTISEVNTALAMIVARLRSGHAAQLPALLRTFDSLSIDARLFSLEHKPHALSSEDLNLLCSSSVLKQLNARYNKDVSKQGYTYIYMYDQMVKLFLGKKILIAGYGREGKSTERLIRRLLDKPDITIAEGNDTLAELAAKGFDMIVKSPGIPMSVFDCVDDKSTITSQTDLFLRLYHKQTIGVTGTKGKSTTANLIYHILSNSTDRHVLLAGNMGVPLFDILDDIDCDTTIVAELSCHQLEAIQHAPHIALLLNLYQEHLDHYASYRDYCLAKLNIATRQQSDDVFIYCKDNDDLSRLIEQESMRIVSHRLAYDEASALQWKNMPIKLKGNHNLLNVQAAWLAVQQLGVSIEIINVCLPSFAPLEHRMELFATKRSVSYYNDSISTIPAATIAALKSIPDVATLILGGFDRGIDYSDLVEYLLSLESANKPIKNLIFTGPAGDRMCSEYTRRSSLSRVIINEASDETAVCQYMHEPTMARSDNFKRIVDLACWLSPSGSSCLLSPAAASYNAFANFEERGKLFKKLVCEIDDSVA